MDKKRIIEQLITQFADGKQTHFAKILNLRQSTIGSWLARHTYDPERIKHAFPQVDGNWLLTGEGNMLLPDNRGEVHVNGHHNTTQVNSTGSIGSSPASANNDKPKEAHSLAILQRENALLKELLAEKERLISVLLNREQEKK